MSTNVPITKHPGMDLLIVREDAGAAGYTPSQGQ
jgi:hypothetical protein